MGKRQKGEFITIPAATFARAPHDEIYPWFGTAQQAISDFSAIHQVEIYPKSLVEFTLGQI